MPNPTTNPTPPLTPFPSPTPVIPDPKQVSKLDIAKKVLGIQYLASGNNIDCVLPGAFGLPKQLALLPNGDILITDLSFTRIQLLSSGTIRTLIGPDETTATSVAAMPDGRVCYIDLKNQLVSVEPRTGNCFDNAPMESFWGTLKQELVHHRHYATRQQAMRDITEYIEIFYNRQRRQERLGFLSPAAYAQKFYAEQLAV
jgi:hypothetical protein